MGAATVEKAGCGGVLSSLAEGEGKGHREGQGRRRGSWGRRRRPGRSSAGRLGADEVQLGCCRGAVHEHMSRAEKDRERREKKVRCSEISLHAAVQDAWAQEKNKREARRDFRCSEQLEVWKLGSKACEHGPGHLGQVGG